MDFKGLTDKAKKVVAGRGGTESLKEDLGELKDVASGEGSLADKAKGAAEALKTPGANEEAGAAQAPEQREES